MALVMHLLEHVSCHINRFLTNILLMGMQNDDHEMTWWTLMQTWTVSKILWKHQTSLSLKSSHAVRACVLSNHVKFRCIYAQVEVISTLAPFTSQRATLVDHGIGDGLVGRHSMTFQSSFDKYFVHGMNHDHETTWWTVMQTWMISKILRACQASLNLETLPHYEGMCLI